MPGNVQLRQPQSHTQLNLTFEPPSDPNGVITGYLVTWKKVKNDTNDSDIGALNQTRLSNISRSFVIKNLGEFTLNAFAHATEACIPYST